MCNAAQEKTQPTFNVRRITVIIAVNSGGRNVFCFVIFGSFQTSHHCHYNQQEKKREKKRRIWRSGGSKKSCATTTPILSLAQPPPQSPTLTGTTGKYPSLAQRTRPSVAESFTWTFISLQTIHSNHQKRGSQRAYTTKTSTTMVLRALALSKRMSGRQRKPLSGCSRALLLSWQSPARAVVECDVTSHVNTRQIVGSTIETRANGRSGTLWNLVVELPRQPQPCSSSSREHHRLLNPQTWPPLRRPHSHMCSLRLPQTRTTTTPAPVRSTFLAQRRPLVHRNHLLRKTLSRGTLRWSMRTQVVPDTRWRHLHHQQYNSKHHRRLTSVQNYAI